jgi:hypothetical protein
MFTSGRSLISVCTPVALVGFGSAEGIPPHDAHEPMAMMAAASRLTSRSTSSAGRPAMVM